MSVSNAAYTVSLGHDSLLFNYYPFSDPYSTPDLEAGWAPWNDVTGGYNPEVGTDTVDLSQGRWSQRTKQDGAIVELYFKGSSLNLLGTIYQAGFDVWLDGKTVETSPGNGRLASFTDLKGTDHRMLLTAHPTSNGSLWFYGAEIGVDLPDSPIINQMTADVDYGGYWIQMNDRQLGTFHAATRAGAYVSLTLHQASAVTVYGIRSLQNGHYNVTLDGNSTTYMAKSSFPSVSVLFAALDLDPSVDHQLTLTNLDEGERLGIVSVNVTTSTPRPASNEIKPAIPLGTKIALIVAGAVALLVIVFFIVFFFLRRVRVGRRSRGKAHSTFNPFQFSTYNPSFVMVDTVTTKLPQTPLVVIGDPNVSIRSRPSGEQFKGEIERENKYDDGDDDDDDDESYQFVHYPLLASTPSLEIPDLGSEFHVSFPSEKASSRHHSRSSRRSHLVSHRSDHHTSEQSDFLHLQDSSHSTDAQSKRSKGSVRSEDRSLERQRSRVRFSTPPVPNLLTLRTLNRGRSLRLSDPRASRHTFGVGQSPTSPTESVPFTVGTSVTFEHPESTPPHSEEAMRLSGEGTRSTDNSHYPSEPPSLRDAESEGFIPAANRQWGGPST
ncbi:hypothetical protein FS842_009954 [Serendipita sp. 407]|nr:hypothetical protein FS842_009954 [Serendipita sp. 407]